MLARFTGGKAGIADYLVYGQKIGREKTRDELDNRLILAGDLALTDIIINNMEDKGQDRYLHITLSFRESDVDENTLNLVANDYKKYLMAAFSDDEYNFYAEAHLPKIKNITNYRTGELIERKPHIHIVIPKTNLLTGKYLNPIGLYEKNIPFLDAIQEKINNKYNLESPKEFVRDTNNNHEQVIARITGNLLSEKNSKFKNELANEIIKSKINNFDSFHEFLSKKGDVVVRNKNKINEYLAVKLIGQSRFINLKSPVFSREFIENGILKTEKLPDKIINSRIDEWINRVSKEQKYIANASTKIKKEYKDLHIKDKVNYLNRKGEEYERRFRKVISKPDIKGSKRKDITSFTQSLPRVPKCYVDGGAIGRERSRSRSTNKLLYGNERDNLGVNESKKFNAMRWSDISTDSLNGGRGVKQTALQQSIINEQQLELINDDIDYKTIRKSLNPDYLLDELKTTYLLTGNFEITTAKDGSKRIKDGNRNYNVSDFLTKKMALTWDEAKEILKISYQKQLNNEPLIDKESKQLSNKELWNKFKNERLPIIKENSKKEWLFLRENNIKNIKNIKDIYYINNKNISKNKQLSKHEKIAQRSINTYNKIVALNELKADFKQLKYELKSNQKSINFYFQNYQKEVMSMSIMDMFKNDNDLVLKSGSILVTEQLEHAKKMKQLIDEVLNKNRFKPAETNKKGHVTYNFDGSKAFIDKGDQLVINKKDQTPEKLLCALEMAVAKFGKNINLEGSEAFKESLIKLAAAANIDVVFKPEKYNELFKEETIEINNYLKEMEEGGYLLIDGKIYTLDENTSYVVDDSFVSHFDDTKGKLHCLEDNNRVQIVGNDKFKKEAIGLLVRYSDASKLDIEPKELQESFDKGKLKEQLVQQEYEREYNEQEKTLTDFDDLPPNEYILIKDQFYPIHENFNDNDMILEIENLDTLKEAIGSLEAGEKVVVVGNNDFKETALNLLKYHSFVDELDIVPKELQEQFDNHYKQLEIAKHEKKQKDAQNFNDIDEGDMDL